MPNWCSNTVSFQDADGLPEGIHLFWEMIDRAMKKGEQAHKDDPKNGPSPDWYGHILKEVGLDPDKYYCRGFVSDYGEPQSNDTCFDFWSETAWEPCAECIDAVVKEFNRRNSTHILFYYISEEPGCDVYETNDDTGEVFCEKYWIDDWTGNGNSEYLDEGDDLHAWLNNAYGTNFKNETVDEINDYFSKKEQYVRVREVYVNPNFIQEV